MATADKLTLAERMAQARERTAEARDARLALAKGQLAPAALHASALHAPALHAPTPHAPAAEAPAASPVKSLFRATGYGAAAPATRPTTLGSSLAAPFAPRASGMGSLAVKSPTRPSAAPGHPASHHGSHHGSNAWQVAGHAGEQLTLMPGQMHFGGHVASMRTLLGSCVAVTIWHPVRKLGGMCHFLLPSRTRKATDELDGRYGDEALQAMVSLLRAAGTSPSEYQAHLCGGADTMPEGAGLKFNVGERNIEQGFSLVDRYGFEIQGVDVGEDVPRHVSLVLATGAVDMRRGKGCAPALDMAGAGSHRR